MIVRQTNGLRLKTELVDKINPTKNRYKERPIFDLVSFSNEKIEEYVYLTVVTTGDRNGSPILVYQVNGPVVTLEKITDFVYRYKDPEDEIYTERLFEAEVIIDNLESKKKQVKVVSDPSVYYLTSQIYPINLIEEAYTSSKGISGRILTSSDLRLFQSIFEESFTSVSRITGIFKQSLFLYNYKDTDSNTYEPLRLNINRVNGVLRQLLLTYSTVPENLKTSLVRVTGVLRQLLINYTYYIPENLKSNINRLDGTSFSFSPYHQIFISGSSLDYNPNDSDNGVTVLQKTATTSQLTNDSGIPYKAYNTSVLDFENGLLDRKNSNVIWNKSGTADVTTTNKLYGTTSFENKVLGDRLYTTSSLLTGNGEKYSVELDVLVNSNQSQMTGLTGNSLPIFSQAVDDNVKSGFLVTSPHETLYPVPFTLRCVNNDGTQLNSYYKRKIEPNTINKYLFTYDGSATRLFVNNELVNVYGGIYNTTPNNHYLMGLNNPNNTSTKGIIDNIIISNGVATKVRETDLNEDKLIVDLSFDGENNSTFIKDNGTLGLSWVVHGNAKISTAQPFDGYSSLSLDSTSSYIQTNLTTTLIKNFTISFNYRTTDLTTASAIFDARSSVGQYDGFLITHPSADPTSLQIYLNGNGSSWNVTLNSGSFISSNINYKIDIVCNNNLLSFYVNNILKSSQQYSFDISIILDNRLVCLGRNSNGTGGNKIGFFKNFKIYKDLAIVPKSINSEINLDFNNNIIDKNNNSVWTNSGVTYDSVNSYKDTSAYFDSTSDYLETNSYYLDHSLSPFKVSFDLKETVKAASGEVFTNNISSSSASSLWMYSSASTVGLDYFNKPTNADSLASATYVNTTYNHEVYRKDFSIFKRTNDVICGSHNLLTFTAFNFNGGNSFRIGKPTATFGSSNGFIGYLDSFKSEGRRKLGKIWAMVWATVNLSSQAIFNPSDTAQITHKDYFPSSTSHLRYATGASPTVTINDPAAITINENPLGKKFFVSAANGTWSSTEAVMNIEFLDSNNNVLAAIKWFRDAMYSNMMSYGLTLASQSNATKVGSYGSTQGILEINSTGIVFTNTAAKTENYIDDFTFNVNLTNLTKYRISGMKAVADYNPSLAGVRMQEIVEQDDLVFDIDKPAAYLPLESNATNLGYSQITTNLVGSPVFTTIAGKKAMRAESGKYVTVNTHNLFKFGLYVDFYLELDYYYVPNETNVIPLLSSSSGHPFMDICINTSGKPYLYRETSAGSGITGFTSTGGCTQNAWNKIIFKRKGKTTSFVVNDVKTDSSVLFDLDFSQGSTYIGKTRSVDGSGYIANFQIFVGTDSKSINYFEKSVLDLDFKPTRKSYLFKDNNNKCIIHPINISYRDYLDSRYCCSFNGTNQYIQLGKNDLFNFGSDDFLINIKFKVNSLTNNWGTLLAGGGTSGVSNNDKYAISINSDGTLRYNYNGSFWKTAASVISTNNIYDLAITRKDFVIKVYLNGVLLSFSNEGSAPLSENINFNFNNNTIIGANLWDGSAGYFNGVIYSIKSFRNTSDISLLNNTILSTPSNIYLPLQKDLVDIKSGTAWTATPSITYVNNAALINLNDSTKISTGANSNLNFGTNDFTIGIDSFKTTTATDSRLVATNAISTGNYPRAEIKQTSTYGVSLTNYPTSSTEVRYKDTKSGDVMSNWFTSKFSKTNNTIFTYVNDSLVDINTCGNGHTFNFNYNDGTVLGGVNYNTLVSNRFGGYLNNFYSNNVADLPIVFPYLYLPYDTTLQDQGVNALSFGSPTTYASLDTLSSIKCARISSTTTNPQYSGIILGTVFSIEANLYIPAKASSGYNIALFGTGVTTNVGFLLTQFTEPWSGSAIPQLLLRTSGTGISFDISSLIGTWIKVKVIKTLTNLTLYVNNNNVGTIDSTNWNNSDFESSRIFYIGDGGSDWRESKTFYINNFRYYKGLVDIPTSENLSKKVLHMKFKKNENTAYFLKDDSRKQVLSSPTLTKYDLVNIENIDCLQFNGSNSVIEIAQNKNLNLLDDDFVISFKWYYIPYVNPGTSQWQVIIGNGTTSSTSNLSYIAYTQDESAIVVRCKDTEVLRVSNQIKAYTWNTVILKRTDKVFNLTINGFSVNSAVSTTDPFNLNFNNITYIGVGKWNNSNEYLKGYLSNLQIYKGTSDTTLLDTEVNETVIIENPPKNIYYPLVLNKLDSFNNMWVQTNPTNPVRLKEFTKGLGTSMYFDGVSGLYSTNYFNRIGLNPFTIECGIKIDSAINSTYQMTILCYGISYNRLEWFSLEVTSSGAIRFIPDRSNLNSFITSNNSVINYNTNYNIAITRDSNYILRIFVNGVKVAEGTVSTCFDSYSQNSGGSYLTTSNYLVLGKRPDYWNSTDSTRGGFKGNIENFHYLVGTCKYTGDYVVTVDDTIKLETKSLLNVDNTTPSSPSSLLDTFNNITYTNTGCTVEQLNGQLRPYSIRCQTNSNRLVSNVSENMFNLGYSNWTIDLIFRPMQTAAEAYLLDTRANSTIFRGLVIRQPETNPTTIRVEVGSSSASSAFENTYQSAANTLVANTTYHLRLVRCRENILIFLNGTLLNTISYGLKDIGYSNKIILFNNDLYNKGFNGYLTQFRYIKGISTNVIAFTQLTEELT